MPGHRFSCRKRGSHTSAGAPQMPTHPVQPPEWIDSAPIRVERTVDIAAPPSVVWGLIADHVGWPKWFTTLDAVEVLGAGSGVGGGRRVTVKKLPLEEEFTV